MPKKRNQKGLDHYTHITESRKNNPPVGLVKGDNDQQANTKTYEYDPHLDPSLQWAGKKERPQFTVDTRFIHVHERIDPQSIIEKLKKDHHTDSLDLNFFDENKLPFDKALDFYKHQEGWSNRLIAGDSLLIMNSLLQKENLAGKVQCVYMDPPYGIKYSSNFQPFYNDNSPDSGEKKISTEPETIKAFRDTWELQVHSYLSYLRDRLSLCRELLNDSGSCFVQIGDENVHHIREIMDEVFGAKNYISLIAYKSATYGAPRTVGLRRVHSYLVWYAKDKSQAKFNRLYKKKNMQNINTNIYNMVKTSDGERRKITAEERKNIESLPQGWRIFRVRPLSSIGSGSGMNEQREFAGSHYTPPEGRQWSHKAEHFEELKKKNRIIKTGNTIGFVSYLDESPYQEYTNNWDDTGPEPNKSYVVQTSPQIIQKCILMTSDPGDLIFDPTCGSGTTAFVAEETGRRWITCDTSRISLTLAKQRVLTSIFKYYKLADNNKDISGGFIYTTFKKPTISGLAQNLEPETISIYDEPLKENNKLRVSGPFTVEGLPSHKVEIVKPLQDSEQSGASMQNNNANITLNEWSVELLKNGVRASANKKLEFNEIIPASGMKYIHAQGETKEDKPQKVMISFGPEHNTLGAQQVKDAWQEAKLHKPDLLLFVAIQFDSVANERIETISAAAAGMQLLKVQMNNDYSVRDLKKGSQSSDNFWLLGEPDVKINKIKQGPDKGKVEVTILGYDYYNPATQKVISENTNEIACWLLDEAYDNRCLIPDQVFILMAKKKQGWDNLKNNLKAIIDDTKLKQYTSNTSLPFEPPENRRIAIKIIDKRGVESLKVVQLEEK